MGPVKSLGRLRVLHAVRFVVLAAVALLVGHTAVFVTDHGVGAEFASQMREGGHDGYWTIYSVLTAGAAVLVLLGAAVRLASLARRLDGDGETDTSARIGAGAGSAAPSGLSGGMPAWGTLLSETDRWNLVNYLRSINGQGAVP